MTNDAGDPASMVVHVVYALPERYWSVRLTLATGATVSQALAAVDPGLFPEGVLVDPAGLAVFSRPVQLSSTLRDGDRLELLRPLLSDPKQARRTRAVESAVKKRSVD